MDNLITMLNLILALFLFFVFLHVFPFNLWLTAFFLGIRTTPMKLMAMRVKEIPPKLIIDNAITAKKAGLVIPLENYENHYLASGNISNVVKAMIAAKKANLELSFEEACSIDLAGLDVFETVIISIYSAVIKTDEIICTTKDSQKLKVQLAITIKEIIQKAIIGTREDTILEKATEQVLFFCNKIENTNKALEQVEEIQNFVIQNLDNQDSAFEILSINISKIHIVE